MTTPTLSPGEPRRVVIAGRLHWRWSDGTTLPVLSGSADDVNDDQSDDPDDDAADDSGDDLTDDTDDDDDEEQPSEKSANKAHRDAARYRVRARERTKERDAAIARAERAEAERDALRGEIAFERAAGSTFLDTGAAWKLADRSLIKLADDGSVEGMDEAIADLVERQPFLLRPDDREPTKRERDPFSASRSGRPMSKARRPKPGYDKAALSKKYPALRDR